MKLNRFRSWELRLLVPIVVGITSSVKAAKKGQETSKWKKLQFKYRDCIKSRRDKIWITRHIMMHQVLYIVQLPNEEGDIHIIIIALGAS